MTEAMTDLPARRAFDRERFLPIADGLAVLLAVTLPWSTSATGIVAAVYVLAVLPLLDAGSLKTVEKTPAVWLPLALVALGLLGILWADIPLAKRFGGVEPLLKLAVLSLVMLHFRKSDRAHWVIAAFIAACTVLLAASLIPAVVPPLRWMWHADVGVPVKDYIAQSGEFLVCMFAMLYLALERVRSDRYVALALIALAILFAIDFLYVTTGRTALVILPVLVVLFGWRMYRWRGIAAAVTLGIVLGAFAWFSSPYLRERTTAVVGEVHRYETQNALTSSGERLEFWKKSVRFIAAAPVLGHGTGSVESQFRGAVVGTSGTSALVSVNPHNQTLMVGIQFGIFGIAILWAMWVAHILLFRADGFVAWFGLLVTVQTIVGSLFNSWLSDFTQGWTYALLVGAAGGAMLHKRTEPNRSEGGR
jgi:O-antigen ligase